MINRDFNTDDFSEEKLQNFLVQANISVVLPQNLVLKNLAVGQADGKDFYFNNTSVLFFAKNLNNHFFHTCITCALYKGREKVTVLDRKDFNADIVTNVNDTMLFLKQHLNLRYEFDGSLIRKEIPELPFEALREAILNAAIHRDYFQKGANVMVELFDNRLEITSPGGLPRGLKEEEFGTRSLLRNPNIANLFLRIGMIEKMGTGVKRIQNMLKEAGLPLVEFYFSDFVTVIFKRTDVLEEKTVEKSSEKSSEKILYLIDKNDQVTIHQMSEELNISERAIEKQLAKLKKEGSIKRVGPDKGGKWKITKH